MLANNEIQQDAMIGEIQQLSHTHIYHLIYFDAIKLKLICRKMDRF